MKPSPIVKQIESFLLIGAEIHDPRTGKLIGVIPTRPANTFVQNWLKCLNTQFTQATMANVTDTGGTLRTLAISSLALNAGAGTTFFGIVVGTNNTAVTLSDTKLNTQVTTNVTHGAMAWSLNTPDATHYQLIGTRQFTNATGSTLNIAEVGLYGRDPSGGFNYCLDRTLMAIALGNTLSTTITYTWNTNT